MVSGDSVAGTDPRAAATAWWRTSSMLAVCDTGRSAAKLGRPKNLVPTQWSRPRPSPRRAPTPRNAVSLDAREVLDP